MSAMGKKKKKNLFYSINYCKSVLYYSWVWGSFIQTERKQYILSDILVYEVIENFQKTNQKFLREKSRLAEWKCMLFAT